MLESGSTTKYILEDLKKRQERVPEVGLLEFALNSFAQTWNSVPETLAMKLRQGEEATQAYNSEMRRKARAQSIINEVTVCNVLLRDKTKAQLFKEDLPKVFGEMFSDCTGESDFTNKIAGLSSLFEVELEPLRSIVKNPAPSMKSIKLLRAWLQESSIAYDAEMIATWEMVISLRNATPIHSNTSEVISVVKFFGCGFPPDYQNLWNNVLSRFLDSLEKLKSMLRSLS